MTDRWRNIVLQWTRHRFQGESPGHYDVSASGGGGEVIRDNHSFEIRAAGKGWWCATNLPSSRGQAEELSFLTNPPLLPFVSFFLPPFLRFRFSREPLSSSSSSSSLQLVLEVSLIPRGLMPRGLAGLRPLLISSREQYLTWLSSHVEKERERELPGYLQVRSARRGRFYLWEARLVARGSGWILENWMFSLERV